MCHFLSAIYFKTGRLVCLPEYSDSHTDLIEHEGIKDDKEPFLRSWVRVELTPPGDWAGFNDFANWSFKLDEESGAPEWWIEKKDDCLAQMQTKVKSMIVTDSRKILLGGCWILGAGAIVEKAMNCRVVAMLGDARIKVSSQFRCGEMRGYSRVNEMAEYSQVNIMWGVSQVNTMRGSSQVCTMRDSSQVNIMAESSRVNIMSHSSQINSMWESSQVNEMRGSSQVNSMSGASQAKPHPVHGTKTKIVNDYRTVRA